MSHRFGSPHGATFLHDSRRAPKPQKIALGTSVSQMSTVQSASLSERASLGGIGGHFRHAEPDKLCGRGAGVCISLRRTHSEHPSALEGAGYVLGSPQKNLS